MCRAFCTCCALAWSPWLCGRDADKAPFIYNRSFTFPHVLSVLTSVYSVNESECFVIRVVSIKLDWNKKLPKKKKINISVYIHNVEQQLFFSVLGLSSICNCFILRHEHSFTWDVWCHKSQILSLLPLLPPLCWLC